MAPQQGPRETPCDRRVTLRRGPRRRGVWAVWEVWALSHPSHVLLSLLHPNHSFHSSLRVRRMERMLQKAHFPHRPHPRSGLCSPVAPACPVDPSPTRGARSRSDPRSCCGASAGPRTPRVRTPMIQGTRTASWRQPLPPAPTICGTPRRDPAYRSLRRGRQGVPARPGGRVPRATATGRHGSTWSRTPASLAGRWPRTCHVRSDAARRPPSGQGSPAALSVAHPRFEGPHGPRTTSGTRTA